MVSRSRTFSPPVNSSAWRWACFGPILRNTLRIPRFISDHSDSLSFVDAPSSTRHCQREWFNVLCMV